MLRIDKIVFFLLVLSAYLHSGCGPAPENADDAELKIEGGIDLDSPNEGSSIVRLLSRGKGFCTGVLVAPDLIVTAGHCLDAWDHPDLSLRFPLASGPASIVRPLETRALRSDDQFFPNFDMGWIKLASPAPAPHAPVALLGESLNLRDSAPMQLLGFRANDACHAGDAQCPMTRLEVELEGSWSSPHLVSLGVIRAKASQQGRTCPGDSGAPTIIQTESGPALLGIVAGKSPIFNTDNQDNSLGSCGSYSTVLTRIGEYQSWLESTSGKTVKVIRPAAKQLSLDFLESAMLVPTGVNLEWDQWFKRPHGNDHAWATVQKLLEHAVLEFKGQMPGDDIPKLFQDPDFARSWLEKVTTLNSLTLGFPVGFPSVGYPVFDLRPLKVLKNLESLSFLARNYQGLEVISELPRLNSLRIIGRVADRGQEQQLNWAKLESRSVTDLSLEQFAAEKIRSLGLEQFPNLHQLNVAISTGSIGTDWLPAASLQSLDTLELEELKCQGGNWPSQAMPQLKAITLRSDAGLGDSALDCIDWKLLPGLTSIFLQGYSPDRVHIESLLLPAQLSVLRRNP